MLIPQHGPVEAQDAELIFYPKFLFHLSPVYGSWAKITARDVFTLTEKPDFKGQNIYFHLNHPIRWVCLVGLIVSFDEYDSPARYSVHLDDGSGYTIELIYYKNHPKRNTPPISFTGIRLHSIVKAKGEIMEFRNTRQITLKQLRLLRDTNAEVDAWKSINAFRLNILSKPWILDEKVRMKLERRAKRKNTMETEQGGKKLRKKKNTKVEKIDGIILSDFEREIKAKTEIMKKNENRLRKRREDYRGHGEEDICGRSESRNSFQKREEENKSITYTKTRPKRKIEKEMDIFSQRQQKKIKLSKEHENVPVKKEDDDDEKQAKRRVIGKGKQRERKCGMVPSPENNKCRKQELQGSGNRQVEYRLGMNTQGKGRIKSDMDLQHAIAEDVEVDKVRTRQREKEAMKQLRRAKPQTSYSDSLKTVKSYESIPITTTAFSTIKDFQNWFANQSLSDLSYELTQNDQSLLLEEVNSQKTSNRKESCITKELDLPIRKEPQQGSNKDSHNRVKATNPDFSILNQSATKCRNKSDAQPIVPRTSARKTHSRHITSPHGLSSGLSHPVLNLNPQCTESTPTIRSLKLLILNRIHSTPLMTFTISTLCSIPSIKSYATKLTLVTNPSISPSNTTSLNLNLHKQLSSALLLLVQDGSVIRSRSSTPGFQSTPVYTSVGRWNLSPIITSVISTARQRAGRAPAQVSIKEIWMKARSQRKGWESVTKGVVGDIVNEVLKEMDGWKRKEKGIWILEHEDGEII